MVALFAVTLFVSAALLFVVQPMFARMLLPLLGGAPAVWNTALVFYQCALLAGYAYAHVASRLAPRRQAVLHLVLVAAAAIALPIAVPHGAAPPAATSPVAWMLGLLAAAVGPPFVAVAATGPLVQRWFATTRHDAARDPYFLYAASNAGSLLGLLAYPLVLEPRLRLGEQSAAWTGGYAVLLLLLATCAVAVWRTHAGAAAAALPAVAPAAAPTVRRRLRWVLLALAPSSLMVGVTTHLTTDLFAMPLLWAIPLALYLASFTIAFASRPPVPHALAVRALPFAVLAVVAVMLAQAIQPLPFVATLHLWALFTAALACHGELAKDRPDPAHLTGFYLWIAVGGALGGAFNALLAPRLFRDVVEYPIALLLAVALVPPAVAPPAESRGRRVLLDALLAVGVAGAAVGSAALVRLGDVIISRALIVLVALLLALPLLAVRRRPVRYALGLAALLVFSPARLLAPSRVLLAERDFFGVSRVEFADGRLHQLVHGTTIHGEQRFVPRPAAEPLGYYHRQGPLGDVFTSLPAARRVGLAGLGAGTIAAYARPGEQWTYFEIDPAVARIARDTTCFTYLASAHAPIEIELGDARRSLAASRDTFDLLVLDAYSSDAIPVHLLTREAFAVYTGRLAPHGVIALHITNRYFDLVPVVAALAHDRGLACRVRRDARADASPTEDRAASIWAAVARTEGDLGAIATNGAWAPAEPPPGARPWTDDWSNPLGALKR